MNKLIVFSPSGVIAKPPALRLAVRRLTACGFDASLDDSALARSQRFAGEDATRLAALHRVASQAPAVAMASRGGYGLTRLLDQIDWPLLKRSVEQGTRWVGHSDFTALQLALLRHGGVQSWAGPMAYDDFGRAEASGAAGSEGVDEVTRDCFCEAMGGELEAVGFRTEAGFDGLSVSGRLWGGNLSMLCAMLGTRHWPSVKGGVLFVEDVNEHPYRVERCLLQLQQAGVLASQKAVLMGAFTAFKPSPLDRGYGLKSMMAHLRSVLEVPLLTGLPFGHVPTKLSLPVGRRVQLLVNGRDVLMGW